MAVSSDQSRLHEAAVHTVRPRPMPAPARVQLLVQPDSLPIAQDPEGQPCRLTCNTFSRCASSTIQTHPVYPFSYRWAPELLPAGSAPTSWGGGGAPFPTPWPARLLVDVLMSAILTGGRRQLTVVLMFIPLMLSDTEHLSVCLFAVCVSLGGMSARVLCPFRLDDLFFAVKLYEFQMRFGSPPLLICIIGGTFRPIQ